LRLVGDNADLLLVGFAFPSSGIRSLRHRSSIIDHRRLIV
jgi:hypothetical protein